MQIQRYLFFVFLMAGSFVSGQVSFKTVPDKTTAEVGERIQLSFIVTTSKDLEVEQIMFPSFSGFQMLGRNVGQNFSFNNGRTTRQYMETVVLLAQKPGKYTIKGGYVMVDGQKLHSNPVTLHITESKKQPKSNEGHLVFMEVLLDDNDVYPNENVNVEIKLYAKSYDALRRRTDLEVPGMSDFQVREISKNKDRNFEQEMINNDVYISESIAQYQLTPKKTGELVIPAFKLRVAIPLDFFEEKIVTVRTNHRTIHVKDFPPKAPTIFRGAVGDFKLVTHIDKEEVNVNESIIYELELLGEGNLSSINIPSLNIPKNIESYPSKPRNAFQVTSTGEKGKIVDKYVLIPQKGGDYIIPKIQFCYFDPKTEKYITIHSEEVKLKVQGDEQENTVEIADTDSITIDSTDTQSILPSIPTEITNIFKKPNNDLKVDEQDAEFSNWWYAGLSLPILAGLVWFFMAKRKGEKEENSSSGFTKANAASLKLQIKTDLKELKQIKGSEHRTHFLKKSQELLNSLIVYLSGEDKNYTVEEAKSILREKRSEDVANKWETVYYQIQSMSYGMPTDEMNLDAKYAAIEELIKESLN